MHQIQKTLLKRLLAKSGQKYSELTSGYNFENNIVFHLKQLLGNGYIEKNGEIYNFTADGVKEAKNEETGLKMFFFGFVCEYDEKYLLREHTEGNTKFYNLPSGKPNFGEKIEDALVRTFFELTDLKLKPENFQYLSLHLKTVKTSKNEVLFDDAFAIYKTIITDKQVGDLELKNGIKWFTLEEIRSFSNRWPEIDLCILKKDYCPYLVYQFTSDYTLN